MSLDCSLKRKLKYIMNSKVWLTNVEQKLLNSSRKAICAKIFKSSIHMYIRYPIPLNTLVYIRGTQLYIWILCIHIALLSRCITSNPRCIWPKQIECKIQCIINCFVIAQTHKNPPWNKHMYNSLYCTYSYMLQCYT